MIHVLSGPDHLAAVAPLAVDGPGRAWAAGLRWGIGHTLGVVLVGLLALVFRDLLPLEAISGWSERIVGIVLIAIGLWGIRRSLTRHVHAHEHEHDGQRHVHFHLHGTGAGHSHGETSDAPHSHTHAAFAVGTLHGLAGSSHFLGVLPALAFPSTRQAIAYLCAYGAGTILAMVGFSSALGWLGSVMALNTARAYRALMLVVSLFAIGTGGYWLAM